MRVPFHILFGSFFLFLILFVMISCNAVAFQTREAWEEYDRILAEIEDSHFKQEVIKQAMEDGETRGYQITVLEDSIYSDRQRYQVKFVYPIRIPIFQIEKSREISGYAM